MRVPELLAQAVSGPADTMCTQTWDNEEENYQPLTSYYCRGGNQMDNVSHQHRSTSFDDFVSSTSGHSSSCQQTFYSCPVSAYSCSLPNACINDPTDNQGLSIPPPDQCTSHISLGLETASTKEVIKTTSIKLNQCPRHARSSFKVAHKAINWRTASVFSVFFVLALLNRSAASSDFHFPDSRQGEFAQGLRHFHIGWPSRVDHTGEFITHHLHAHHDISVTRYRRSAVEAGPSSSTIASQRTSSQHDQRGQRTEGEDQTGEVLHYRIPLHQDKDVVLELQQTRMLLAPSALLEKKVSRFSNVSDSVFNLLKHHKGCHLSGSIHGEDISRAAISACDGLRGFIQLDGVEYIIEPVKEHNKSEDGAHPHLVYKRSALPDHLDFLSREKRAEPSCGVQEAYDRALAHRERWERHRRSTSRRYSTGASDGEHAHSRKRRSISIEKHVETLVVVDPDMVNFYVNEDIETYVLTVMNIVATLFHDASIGNAVNIVIVRIMLLQDPSDDLTITHHADNTLKSFCKWQKRINFRDDDHPNHHDVAILMTRRNICSRNNEPCSTLGLAQVAGLCQPHRTCSINEDTGLSLAWTVAHELGHNFGMKHDTTDTCKSKEPKIQYVMAPHLTWDRTPTSWSTCSRTSITEFLDRNWGYCLDDPPNEHDFQYPTLPAGTMYDADHQCRLLYGSGAERCNGIEVLENICVTLWCRVNNKCSTKLQAAAVGTICGTNKWCFNGQCVDIGERPQAIDGEWGQWGEWSGCTRTCGAGVSTAQRHCNHPPPSNGGKYCTGERKRYRICNTDPCDEEAKSFRALQCEEFNEIPYKGSQYEWEALMTPETPCQLHCKPKNMFFSVLLKDIVTDGTPCVIGSRHMCISGRCRHIGCDWEVDSDAVEDRCGVCFGDGSTCTTIKQQYNETKQLGYVEATIIPKGARNIRVEEVAEASNFLALRNDRGEYYLNGHWFIQWSGDYEMAGTVVHYKRAGNKEKFSAPGPLKEPLHIMLLIQTHNPGVEFEYTVPKENVSDIRQPEFAWDYTGWSHCTVSCGGGTQRQAVVCREKEAGNVDDNYCGAITKPDDMLRACNVHLCPARWWAGPWQHCSVTCGDQGIHRRTVICVRSLGQDEQIALEDSVCQGLEKPLEVAPCRHKDPCPTLGNWEMEEWSNCTRSCNGGVQFRKVACVGGDRCPEPKPDTERPCNEQKCTVSPEELFEISEGGGEEDDDALKNDTRSLAPTTFISSSGGFDNTLKEEVPHIAAYPIVDDVDKNVLLGSDDNDDDDVVDDVPETVSIPNMNTIQEGGQSDTEDDKQMNDQYGHFRWETVDWTECSVKCGRGYMTREVRCSKVENGVTVLPTLCDLNTKPNAIEECIKPTCMEWQTDEWAECSATCGEAVQTRRVTCPVPGLCDPHKEPEGSRNCKDLPRCAAWVYGDWSKCTKTCGGGRQERLVQCVDLTSQHLAKGCPHDGMPAEIQDCNKEACPAEVNAALSQSCESNEMSYKVCRMLKRIGLCHKQYVQSKCCRTCTDHSRPKPDTKKLS